MGETVWVKISKIIQLKRKKKKGFKPSSWSLVIMGNRKAQVILKLAGLNSTCKLYVA